MSSKKKMCLAVLGVCLLLGIADARAGEVREFGSGSLIVPMDLAYQDHGMFQAYGLVFQLLRQGVKVYWVIDPEKAWHRAPWHRTPRPSWRRAREAPGWPGWTRPGRRT